MNAPTAARRNQTIETYYPVARAIAKSIHRRLPREVDLDDLIGAAVTGLVEAVDRYDDSRQVTFDNFARFRIRGAVVDSLRKDDWVPRSVRRRASRLEGAKITLRRELGSEPTREQVAERLEITPARLDEMARDAEIRPLVSLDAPAPEQKNAMEPPARDADPEERTLATERRTVAMRQFGQLPEREQTAIRMYYLEERPLKEVGRALGVSESRACQLATRGVTMIRDAVRPSLV